MDDIIISSSIVIPETAVTFTFSRSGGKGGQNVNKVSTKVELSVDLTQIRCPERLKRRILQRLADRFNAAGLLRISSQESRSQWQNRQTAVEKLKALVVDASIEEKYRVATKPTRSSKVRRVDGKKADSRKKQMRRTPVRHSDE